MVKCASEAKIMSNRELIQVGQQQLANNINQLANNSKTQSKSPFRKQLTLWEKSNNNNNRYQENSIQIINCLQQNKNYQDDKVYNNNNIVNALQQLSQLKQELQAKYNKHSQKSNTTTQMILQAARQSIDQKVDTKETSPIDLYKRDQNQLQKRVKKKYYIIQQKAKSGQSQQQTQTQTQEPNDSQNNMELDDQEYILNSQTNINNNNVMKEKTIITENQNNTNRNNSINQYLQTDIMQQNHPHYNERANQLSCRKKTKQMTLEDNSINKINLSSLDCSTDQGQHQQQQQQAQELGYRFPNEYIINLPKLNSNIYYCHEGNCYKERKSYSKNILEFIQGDLSQKANIRKPTSYINSKIATPQIISDFSQNGVTQENKQASNNPNNNKVDKFNIKYLQYQQLQYLHQLQQQQQQLQSIKQIELNLKHQTPINNEKQCKTTTNVRKVKKTNIKNFDLLDNNQFKTGIATPIKSISNPQKSQPFLIKEEKENLPESQQGNQEDNNPNNISTSSQQNYVSQMLDFKSQNDKEKKKKFSLDVQLFKSQEHQEKSKKYQKLIDLYHSEIERKKEQLCEFLQPKKIIICKKMNKKRDQKSFDFNDKGSQAEYESQFKEDQYLKDAENNIKSKNINQSQKNNLTCIQNKVDSATNTPNTQNNMGKKINPQSNNNFDKSLHQSIQQSKNKKILFKNHPDKHNLSQQMQVNFNDLQPWNETPQNQDSKIEYLCRTKIGDREDDYL